MYTAEEDRLLTRRLRSEPVDTAFTVKDFLTARRARATVMFWRWADLVNRLCQRIFEQRFGL